jgi:Ca2+-binding EF-hand superfamily protein
MKSLLSLILITFGMTCFAHGGGMDGMDKKFKDMDTDHDGKISAAEHAAGAAAMFNMLDGNHDGKVTADEMQSHMNNMEMGKKMKHEEMSAKDKIAKIDTDGDGALTAQEHADGSAKMFTMMDKDNDGFLTRKEMAKGHHEMMKK